jgi:FAD/FMN-containing dehydrogenase
MECFRRSRHSVAEMVNDTVRRIAAMKMNTDYAVPLARNREMLTYCRQQVEQEFPGKYLMFGHIGDAHVHIQVFSKPRNPEHATSVLADLARRAVTSAKAHLLRLQYGDEHFEACAPSGAASIHQASWAAARSVRHRRRRPENWNPGPFNLSGFSERCCESFVEALTGEKVCAGEDIPFLPEPADRAQLAWL